MNYLVNFSYRFLSLILCITVLAFSSSVGQSVSAGAISDDFVSYNLRPGIATKRLSELISGIEFTRLEETDESLIGYANNYHQVNDRVVFTDASKTDVYIFTGTGEFEGRFNRKGGGPEEYAYISNLWLKGDTVFIYVRARSINKYDLKGNFIESSKVSISANHVVPYANGYALDSRYSALNDTSFFDFTVVDKGFNIQAMYLPNPPSGNNRFMITIPSIHPYKTGVIYNGIMRDSIYYYSSDGFRPFMHFDLGSDWFFKENKEVPMDLFSQIQESKKVWSILARPGNQLVHLMAFGGEEGKNNYLIDRATGKAVRMSTLKNDRTEKFLFNTSFWREGSLYGYVQSTDVLELISELDKSQYTFNKGTTLEEIESSENPALVKVKFKNSSDW